MYCECEYGDGRLPLLFIVNPAAHSGEGYGLWKQAEAVLQERSIPYEVVSYTHLTLPTIYSV